MYLCMHVCVYADVYANRKVSVYDSYDYEDADMIHVMHMMYVYVFMYACMCLGICVCNYVWLIWRTAQVATKTLI